MKNLENNKNAENLIDFINEMCTNGYEKKDYLKNLHSHFKEDLPREYDDPFFIAIKALKKLKKSKVPEKALYNLVRCMELESIKMVLDIITGHLPNEQSWGVFLLDKKGKPKTRIQEGELVEMMNWEDTLSKKYKRELKEQLKSSQ
jgi:hypothetical protein